MSGGSRPAMAHPLRKGAFSGGVAGAVAVALMYVLAPLLGTKPLPQLLQEPILALMPGPVFGFLIDNLQHLGKVLEEVGLIGGLIGAGAALGAVYGKLELRRVPQGALVVTGAAWLLTMILVLPLLNDGFFALNEGLMGPAVYALLFVVFATVMQLAFRPLDAATDPGRRRVLNLLPTGLGLAGLGVLGVRLVPGWYEAVAAPPESQLGGASPDVTPVPNFYVVSKNFTDPVVPAQNWRLTVSGLVRNRLQLDYQQMRSRPSVQRYVTFACISNDVGGNLISTGLFTGFVLRDLLQEAGPMNDAKTVAYRAADGFTESYPLSLVMNSADVLVAYDLDGQPLPDRHGFPARIVLPGHYGMKQPKWLEAIELRSDDPGGFWEQQGWDRVAVVRTISRFDYPRDGFIVKRGPVQVAGIAFAGTRGVSSVEVSTDGGQAWSHAYLKPPLSDFTWTLWTFPWQPPREGVYTLLVRARDGKGALQDPRQSASFPAGATGYHRIQVTVSR